MTVRKEAVAGVEVCPSESLAIAAELEAASGFSKTPLRSEQVYLFSVRLCDNQVDRDEEYFDRAGLEQLAPLFVGKTGVFDHEWSAKNQTARIYRTEVCPEPGVVEVTGEAACYIKGYAYMLRTAGNEDLIAEIEAGIKKEVSVSCTVQRSVCSICGEDIHDQSRCSHVKGRVYEGRRCVAKLEDPTDAFEWSFVAVPAQRNAGVMKAARKDKEALGKLLGLQKDGVRLEEAVERLQKEAALGRQYVTRLRAEVVRLGLLGQEELDQKTLAAITEKLEEPELLKLKASYEVQARVRLPLGTQLRYEKAARSDEKGEDHVFLI